MTRVLYWGLFVWIPVHAWALSVDSFTLVNADTDQDIGALTNGAVINLAITGTNLNVRANTTPSTVGSVRFAYDGNPSYRTENVAPYALAGDNSGNYYPWTPTLGTHTLTATPYSEPNAGDTSGVPLTVVFEVIHTVGSNRPPTVVITNPVTGAFFVSPTTITIAAIATDPDGIVNRVEFFESANKLGEASASPYSMVWSNVPAGTYTLTARAIDNANATGTSSAVIITVGTPSTNGVVSGTLRKWHRVSITFDGPNTSETATPNPFLDYRLNVIFRHLDSGKTLMVPGFYAADGNASETGAATGNKWRVHFTPDAEGVWTYVASFRTGPNIAVSTNVDEGTPVSFDGASGSFTIGPTDKSGRDHRAKGLLQYVGKRYLRFAETGEYFLKGGADSPENFLAYYEFDGTPATHRYQPHAGDFKPGDPTWQGGKGTNIIGALNYLASQGMNSVYFLTMNVNGDGKDVWPWTSSSERYRFDCSKLDQWEIVFTHMDQLGLLLHVVTQEQENDQLLDGGALGVQRKLYYRELIARFAHHLALVWNLGEENTNTDAERKAFCEYIRALDPYDHPIVVHTFPGQKDAIYTPLLGFPVFEGASLQNGNVAETYTTTTNWMFRSARAGRPWIVCLDEIGPANEGVKPDSVDPTHDNVRKTGLWANLMAGGAGCEWYFGYSYPNDDLDCEDWRSRHNMWQQTRYALEFFQKYLPFADMVPSNTLTSATDDYCFAKPGEIYAVYLPNGGTTQLDLGNSSNRFLVRWYNPRTGGSLQTGSVSEVNGPGVRSLGYPPSEPTQDWAVLVRPNRSPEVYAGAPQTIRLPDSATLAGVVTDDGEPYGTLTSWWNQVSGPGPVTIIGSRAQFELPGEYVLRLFADDGESRVHSDVFITVNDSFVAWRIRHGVTTELEDDDGDGLVNLLEYILGRLPQQADFAGTFNVTVTNDHLTLTYTRNKFATDFILVPEVAADLAGEWSNDGVTVQLLSDDGEIQTLRARDPVPIHSSHRRFMRLRISAP